MQYLQEENKIFLTKCIKKDGKPPFRKVLLRLKQFLKPSVRFVNGSRDYTYFCWVVLDALLSWSVRFCVLWAFFWGGGVLHLVLLDVTK